MLGEQHRSKMYKPSGNGWASTARILTKHVIPTPLPAVSVQATLGLTFLKTGYATHSIQQRRDETGSGLEATA